MYNKDEILAEADRISERIKDLVFDSFLNLSFSVQFVYYYEFVVLHDDIPLRYLSL